MSGTTKVIKVGIDKNHSQLLGFFYRVAHEIIIVTYCANNNECRSAKSSLYRL